MTKPLSNPEDMSVELRQPRPPIQCNDQAPLDLVGEFLTPSIESADSRDRTEVLSTEGLLHGVEEVNTQIMKDGIKEGPFQRAGSLLMGIMDEKAFYQNQDIDVAAEEAKLKVMESEVNIGGVAKN